MKLPEDLPFVTETGYPFNMYEAIVRDCAKVVMDEIGSTRSEIRDAILARYGLEPK